MYISDGRSINSIIEYEINNTQNGDGQNVVYTYDILYDVRT